jgi:hypothetical protein
VTYPTDPRNELMILAAEIVPKIKQLNQQIETILDTYGDDDNAIASYLNGFCINGKKDPYLEYWAKSLQGFTDHEPDYLLTPSPALSVSDEKTEFLAYFREYYPKMMELLAGVRQKEEIAYSPYKHDDDLLAQKIDEFWEPVSKSEQTKIFNLMECL